MNEMSCKCHRIDISMVYMSVVWISRLNAFSNLGFEVEMQYGLFIRIGC